MIITSKSTPLLPLMFITLSPDWTGTIKCRDAERNTDTTLRFPAAVRTWPLPFTMEINAVLFQSVKVQEQVWQTTSSAEVVQWLVKLKERTNFNGPTYMKTTCRWVLAAVAGALKVLLGETAADPVGIVAVLHCAGLGLAWQAAVWAAVMGFVLVS